MPGLTDGSEALVAEVEYATQQGTERLQQGEREQSLGLFQVGYRSYTNTSTRTEDALIFSKQNWETI